MEVIGITQIPTYIPVLKVEAELAEQQGHG
jgi:hypothetical protein